MIILLIKSNGSRCLGPPSLSLFIRQRIHCRRILYQINSGMSARSSLGHGNASCCWLDEEVYFGGFVGGGSSTKIRVDRWTLVETLTWSKGLEAWNWDGNHLQSLALEVVCHPLKIHYNFNSNNTSTMHNIFTNYSTDRFVEWINHSQWNFQFPSKWEFRQMIDGEKHDWIMAGRKEREKLHFFRTNLITTWLTSEQFEFHVGWREEPPFFLQNEM